MFLRRFSGRPASLLTAVGAALWLCAGVASAAALIPGGGGRSVREQASVTFNCMHASAADREAVFDALRAAGASWARINVDWRELEPAAGVYSSDVLASLDGCVGEARAHGIRVLVVFVATPAWARHGGTIATPPDDPADYAAAISYLARRYHDRVGAWEIWNEEDSRAFWRGTVERYVQLLRSAYPAVKDGDPDALVVFGGTRRNDAAWVRACYALGAKGSFDVMATHPYPKPTGDLEVAHALRSATAVRRVMLASGDSRPIWFTELGWSSPHSVSEADQAGAVSEALDFVHRRLPFVANVFWFEAKNEIASVGPESWQGGLSLIAPDLRPRPALAALAAWIDAG